MNYHPENDMTEDEQAYWEAKAEEAGKGPGASPCSAQWVFECPICGKSVRAEETESHLKDHAEALKEAEILIAEIMRGEVNPEDEAEKWVRAFSPQFSRQND